MILPKWHSPVYFYLRDYGVLRNERDPGAVPVVYRYFGRGEALRTGIDLIRAALRPDPRWRW